MRRWTRRGSTLAVLATAAAFGISAGGEAETSGIDSVVNLKTPAGDPLSYDKSAVSATARDVRIEYDNQSGASHDVRVETAGGTDLGGTPTIGTGMTSVDLELDPGTYTFFCSVHPNMTGTLTAQ